MRPLRVTAELGGPIALPGGPLALDALLAWAVCAREGHPQPVDEIKPVEIPVQREPGGRFHMCSFSVGEVEEYEQRWVNRRFPLTEAQGFAGAKLKRIQVSAGPCKSFRLPLETAHMRDDRLTWWCIGDAEAISALLPLVTHLGKRRAVGNGRVVRWTVEKCETWGEGFPVVLNGQPLRPLPPDWPGLADDVAQEYRTISYPYWDRRHEQLCAVPA